MGAFRCHNAAYGRCYAQRTGFPVSQHGIFNSLLHQTTDLLFHAIEFYGVEYFGKGHYKILLSLLLLAAQPKLNCVSFYLVRRVLWAGRQLGRLRELGLASTSHRETACAIRSGLSRPLR